MASFATGMSSQQAITWQWMDDWQTWMDYDAATSALIESYFVNGSPSTLVSSATGGRAGTGASYNIVYATMQQINIRTGFLRLVRRNTGLAYVPAERWSWNDGSRRQRWVEVPPWVCSQMIACRDRRGEYSTVVNLFGNVYEFSLARMDVINQTSNTSHELRVESLSLAGAAQAVAAPAGAAAVGGAVAAGASSFSAGVGGDTALYQSVVRVAADYTASIGPDETCAVCLDGFNVQERALLLPNCRGHYMHSACILKAFSAMGPKCPTCSTMYGPIEGDQPDGTMSVRTRPRGAVTLSGYRSVGTIVISYNFPSGIQGARHPNTGHRYHGTSRTAYLPDNAEGREVLELLRKAFAQKVTFTVGTSVTTGRSDCVVWNGVHHKTNVSGGSSYFGYPDGGYFARVKAELAAKGIR